jgi:hypothetical protein
LGSESEVQDLGFWVEACNKVLGFEYFDLGLRNEGVWVRVYGLGFQAMGLGL